MFTTLEISNFRGFRKFRIPQLRRINLLTGKNNTGKTALLESLFLLCGAGNPQMAINSNVIRGLEKASGHRIPDTYWKPLFNAFDTANPVSISARHTAIGVLALKVTLEQEGKLMLPLDDDGPTSLPSVSADSALLFSFHGDTTAPVQGRIRVAANGFTVEQPDSGLPFTAIFLSSRVGSTTEDAVRLGQLRKRKQGDLLIDALRLVEPRIQHVEDNSASGVPMIWADIGLSELVPLPAMGEGMTRIARLMLAISAAPKGIVLVDELENGLHHSALGSIWNAVAAAASRFDTQVVASTHSYECAMAAAESLDDVGLLVHRLENGADEIRCITYDQEEAVAAFSHGLEVR